MIRKSGGRISEKIMHRKASENRRTFGCIAHIHLNLLPDADMRAA